MGGLFCLGMKAHFILPVFLALLGLRQTSNLVDPMAAQEAEERKALTGCFSAFGQAVHIDGGVRPSEQAGRVTFGVKVHCAHCCCPPSNSV